MSYKLPSPSINQILTRASQALAGSDMFACLMGPLYRVVKLGAGFTFAAQISSTLISYPVLDAGSTVDLSSITLTVQNGKAEIASLSMGTNTDFIFNAGLDYIITGTDMVAAGVKSGDAVELPNNGGIYTVSKIDELDNTKLWFTTIVGYNIPRIGQTYKIYRTYSAYVTTSGFTSDQTGVTVTSLVNEQSKNFISGIVKVNYRAKRTDLTGLYRVDTLSKLQADMETDIQNPLGFYLADIMMAASGSKQVLAYIVANDVLSAYTTGLSDLTISREPYLIVPMSTNSAINQAVAAHCNTMSQPDPSYFRCAIVNAPIVTEKIITTSVAATVTL